MPYGGTAMTYIAILFSSLSCAGWAFIAAWAFEEELENFYRSAVFLAALSGLSCIVLAIIAIVEVFL